LLLVVQALNAHGLRFGLRERWQEQGGKDCDDRDDDKQFDQRKAKPCGEALASAGEAGEADVLERRLHYHES
jgi:alpha-L-fucosidase